MLRLFQVCCGQFFTLAITEDGSRVFAWGKSDYSAFGLRDLSGDHYRPVVRFYSVGTKSLFMCLSVYIVAESPDSHGSICEGCCRQ